MHHQDRNGDLLQVFGEVGLGECDDAVIVRLGSPHHALTPPIPNHGLGWLRAGAVVTVKRPRGKIVMKLDRLAATCACKSSNTCLGRPFGLEAVLTISGGTDRKSVV